MTRRDGRGPGTRFWLAMATGYILLAASAGCGLLLGGGR